MNQSYIVQKSRTQASSFSVEVSDDFFVSRLPVHELEENWSKICKDSNLRGLNLWDGIYYRLENLSDLKRGGQHLVLRNIQYSAVRALIAIHENKGLDTVDYPLHVNTGALIRTSDGVFIFGKGPGGVEFVGGGLQSSELQVRTGKDLERNILKEIYEEINIGGSEIEKIESIGFLFSGKTMSIIQIFEVVLSLQFEEVKKIFNERKTFEFSEIVGIEGSQLSSFLTSQSDYLQLVPQLLF